MLVQCSPPTERCTANPGRFDHVSPNLGNLTLIRESGTLGVTILEGGKGLGIKTRSFVASRVIYVTLM